MTVVIDNNIALALGALVVTTLKHGFIIGMKQHKALILSIMHYW